MTDDSSKRQSLLEDLDHWAATRPDEPWLIEHWTAHQAEISWAEGAAQVKAAAAWIAGQLSQSGARVGLLSPNRAHWMLADMSTMASGNVIVPLFPTMNADTVGYIVDFVDIDMLFLGGAGNWEQVRHCFKADIPIVRLPGAPRVEGAIDWDEMVAAGTQLPPAKTPHDQALATIVFTSGTTGRPKGVMHSMRTLREAGYYFNESQDTFLDDLRHGKPQWFLGAPHIWEKLQQVEAMPTGEAASPNGAEQQVLDAIRVRGVADFSELPEASRLLRATFLEELIAGTRPDWPQLRCPLRIRGARIQGPIRALPTSRDGRGMTILFWSCHFDATVDFSGADFLSLRLVDCTLPAFIGISLSTKADLDLSGSHFSGVCDHASDLADVGSCAVHLNHANIGGRLLLSATPNARFETNGSVRLDGARIESNLELRGALLRDADEAALSARSSVIGGNVELLSGQGHRCEVYGEVSMVAAHVTGDLDCRSAQLHNPDGRALHCEDLVVESVFLSRDDPELPFQACGRLNFLTATVGGSFFMTNALLCPGPDYTGLIGKGGPVAMNLQQMRISNALIMFNVGAMEPGGDTINMDTIKPVQGWFMFAGVQMNTLILHVGAGWPAPGYLDIDGMSYERVRHVDGGNLVAATKKWLRHQYVDSQPDATTFRPQPYEQLSRVLRNSGQTREADAIAVEKIRMRLAARVDSPWLRLFPRLLMLISNHGYSTSRAIFSFLVFVTLGALLYTAAIGIFGQPFSPFEQPPEATTYILPVGLGTVSAPLGCPGLDTVQYALDFALPVINLGQDTFCRFVPVGSARWLWLTLHSLFAIFGAGLSAVVVLTLTGLLRRD